MVAQLNSEVKCLKESHSTLENRITDLEMELDIKNDLVRDKDDIMSDLTTENKDLKDTLLQLKKVAKGNNNETTQYKEKIKKLEYALKKLQGSLDEANDLKKIMKKKLKRRNKEGETTASEVFNI